MTSDERRLFGRWVRAFTLGELIGFGLLPALGGTLAYAASEGLAPTTRAVALYGVAVVGGLGEGAVLAWFQLGPLSEVFPALSRRRWVLHTAAAASVAWALGMLGPTLDEVTPLPVAAQVALGVASGVLILLSIGFVQARLLRPHTERSGAWLTANVVGWLLGLPFTFLAPALLPDDAPPLVFAGAFAIGGVLMGATVGAVTGVALLRLARTRPPQFHI